MDKAKNSTFLRVDLSTGQVTKGEIAPEIASKFLGGSGVGWRLLVDELRAGVDPLSPENVIVLSVGELVGSLCPGASKVGAITKFPIIASEDGKHFVGESTSGGRYFGPMLKMAGYDHLIITGAATSPVYLRISDDEVEIVDASNLWGKGVDEVTAKLVAKEGELAGVIAIGLAGENKVLYSMAFIDKTNSLGRAGLGAVMGSKKLKAIVARGIKGVQVAEPGRFKQLVDELHFAIAAWPGREHWIKLGMGAGWETFKHTQYPGKWTKEKWDRLYGEFKRLESLDKVIACNSCLIGCRVKWRIRDGEFSGEVGFGSPYGKSATSGQLLDIEDHRRMLHLVARANDEYGIDFYTTTRLIDFVTTLYQQGKLTKKNTDGLELGRSYDTYCKLFDKVAHREGFGDILADGWLGLYKELGIDPQDYWYGGICKGVDFIYDARASNFHPLMMTFFTRPRPHHGGSHTLTTARGKSLAEIRNQVEGWGIPPAAVERIFTPVSYTGKFNVGRYTKHMEDWMRVKNALGVCSIYTFFDLISGQDMAKLYSAAVGIEVSGGELMKGGERISNLAKLLNMREGFTREDDKVPELWFRPMDSPEGRIEMHDYFQTTVLRREDIARLLDDYYDERGWDKTTGLPTAEKLAELGLKELSAALIS